MSNQCSMLIVRKAPTLGGCHLLHFRLGLNREEKMRRACSLAVLCLSFLFIGVRPALPDGEGDSRTSLGDTEAQQFFDRLTKKEWRCGAAPPGPSFRRETLVFRRNGTYHWTVRPDVFNVRTGEGRWSMTLNAKDCALVHLNENADVAVALKNGELMYIDRPFQAGDDIQYARDEAILGVRDLKPVEPSADWKRLVGTRWKKANDLSLCQYADRLHFKENGRYVESHRNGEFVREGTWSVVVRGSNHVLITDPDGERPDPTKPRESRDLPSGGTIVWLDDLLVINDCYYPEDKKTDTKVFVSRTSSDIRIRGEYKGAFVRGVPKPIRLSCTSLPHPNETDLALESLRITLQARKGFHTDGEATVLLDKPLGNLRLAAARTTPKQHGDTWTDSIEVTPTIDGEAWLKFSLYFKGYGNVKAKVVCAYAVEIQKK